MTCPRHPDGTPWRSTALRGSTGWARLDGVLGLAVALCVTTSAVLGGVAAVALAVLAALAMPQR